MARKRSAPDNEDAAWLVQCPRCKQPKGKGCMVNNPSADPKTGEPRAPYEAKQAHATRIAAGLKWRQWHKGITT